MNRYINFLFYLIRNLFRVFVHILRIITSILRTFPDFIIVGAQKAGTTSLYNYLIQHESIIPAFKKEVQFFDLNYNKGLLWYRSFFPTKIYKFIIKKFSNRELITGEASPFYILHPLVPKRLYLKFPKMKIIMLLRNPVDRTYSQYYHSVNVGVETLSFKLAIEREESRIKGEVEKLKKNKNYISPTFPGFAYKTRSIYIDQIKNWYRYFPKDQILIIKSEDLFSNPQIVMDEILKFLNLPKMKQIKYKKYHSEAQNKINPQIKEYLNNYFKPYNQQLYQFLNRDFEWE